MRVVPVPRRSPRSLYRIVGGRDVFTLTLDDGFWAEGLPIYDEATASVHTELDANITAICDELKYALYYVALGEQPKH